MSKALILRISSQSVKLRPGLGCWPDTDDLGQSQDGFLPPDMLTSGAVVEMTASLRDFAVWSSMIIAVTCCVSSSLQTNIA